MIITPAQAQQLCSILHGYNLDSEFTLSEIHDQLKLEVINLVYYVSTDGSGQMFAASDGRFLNHLERIM